MHAKGIHQTAYQSNFNFLSTGLIFIILLFSSQPSNGQTTSISGVVNSYYAVTQILATNDGIRVANSAGLSQYDQIMIIQMKGASMNTANTSSFGDTTALNNAGNYEIATICSIQGDSIYLFFTLLNQYTISGKVQVVKFAKYSSALVTDTIKAAPWDNTTGTGGVVAIMADNDLTLNAPISADSAGYRGGSFKLSNGTCGNGFPVAAATSYYYDANSLTPQNGAFKGEGVVDITSAQSGGRGAPANGGGGGNNHNNGGAGGANLSAGGNGGGNSSSAGCKTSLPGMAGKPLNSWSGSKIFPGGGGGAGQANDGFVASYGGGHGGGIIFIQANNLFANGYKISGNGKQGGPSLSDGASGGGAGGTIIMNILNTYTGTLSIETRGGDGGVEDDGGNINRCYGAGGGGSGGAIYFTGAMPTATISVAGGLAGGENSRNAGCAVAIPSTAGSDGSIFSSYAFMRSFNPAGSCHSVLPIQLLSFTATMAGKKSALRWEMNDAGSVGHFLIEKYNAVAGWVTKAIAPGISNLNKYDWIDETPNQGINRYRIKVIDKQNAFFYSSTRQVFFESPNNMFELYPNPASKSISISGNFSPGAYFNLIDFSGRTVWMRKLESGNRQLQIDLPKLAPGVYMVSIENFTRKLIIQ